MGSSQSIENISELDSGPKPEAIFERRVTGSTYFINLTRREFHPQFSDYFLPENRISNAEFCFKKARIVFQTAKDMIPEWTPTDAIIQIIFPFSLYTPPYRGYWINPSQEMSAIVFYELRTSSSKTREIQIRDLKTGAVAIYDFSTFTQI